MFAKTDDQYLTANEFKQFTAFIFDLNLRTKIGKDHFKKILARLGKSEHENFPKDLIIDFVVETGAFELRKAVDEVQLASEDDNYNIDDDDPINTSEFFDNV